MTAAVSDYEAARQAKIRENQEKLKAIGLSETVKEVLGPQQNASVLKAPKRRRAPASSSNTEKRASARNANSNINYNEDANDALRGFRMARTGGGGGGGYYKSVPLFLDDEDAHEARVAAGILSASCSSQVTPSRPPLAPNSASKRRGPQDSGLGVRKMGGKVYDSTYGVTCHWCRQKTLAESVTCTGASCGARRMPVSFCKSCLLNRHGEDWKTARDSGCWICPPCRGSCGPGCIVCCNCGPCRKKAGLEPTGQVKALAVADGFNNVHDWLVYKNNGTSAEALIKRKERAPWGAFLKGPATPAKDGVDGGVADDENAKKENDNAPGSSADEENMNAKHGDSKTAEQVQQKGQRPKKVKAAKKAQPRKANSAGEKGQSAEKDGGSKSTKRKAPDWSRESRASKRASLRSQQECAAQAETMSEEAHGCGAVIRQALATEASPSQGCGGVPELQAPLKPRRLNFDSVQKHGGNSDGDEYEDAAKLGENLNANQLQAIQCS